MVIVYVKGTLQLLKEANKTPKSQSGNTFEFFGRNFFLVGTALVFRNKNKKNDVDHIFAEYTALHYTLLYS